MGAPSVEKRLVIAEFLWSSLMLVMPAGYLLTIGRRMNYTDATLLMTEVAIPAVISPEDTQHLFPILWHLQSASIFDD